MDSISIVPRLLTVRDAARYLGVSTSYLNQGRLDGLSKSPGFVRLGRCVRYDVRDLDAWIEARRARCGSNSLRA